MRSIWSSLGLGAILLVAAGWFINRLTTDRERNESARIRREERVEAEQRIRDAAFNSLLSELWSNYQITVRWGPIMGATPTTQLSSVWVPLSFTAWDAFSPHTSTLQPGARVVVADAYAQARQYDSLARNYNAIVDGIAGDRNIGGQLGPLAASLQTALSRAIAALSPPVDFDALARVITDHVSAVVDKSDAQQPQA